MPLGVKRKPQPEPRPDRLEGVDYAICVSAFRPAAVARMIEAGEHLPLDDERVQGNPHRFAVVLADLIADASDK